MNRTYTRCLTLRIEPNVDDLLAEAAYDRRLTKSDFIRSAIRHILQQPNADVSHDRRRERTCRYEIYSYDQDEVIARQKPNGETKLSRPT